MLQPSLTLSFSLPPQNNPKTKQCCTGVCSRDWIMVNITFHASNRTEVPTQVQAPKQTEEGGCSQRLLRALLPTDALPRELLQLPAGNAAPRGKRQCFHIGIFFIQQVTKLLGKTAGETGFLYVSHAHSNRVLFFFLQGRRSSRG